MGVPKPVKGSTVVAEATEPQLKAPREMEDRRHWTWLATRHTSYTLLARLKSIGDSTVHTTDENICCTLPRHGKDKSKHDVLSWLSSIPAAKTGIPGDTRASVLKSPAPIPHKMLLHGIKPLYIDNSLRRNGPVCARDMNHTTCSYRLLHCTSSTAAKLNGPYKALYSTKAKEDANWVICSYRGEGYVKKIMRRSRSQPLRPALTVSLSDLKPTLQVIYFPDAEGCLAYTI